MTECQLTKSALKDWVAEVLNGNPKLLEQAAEQVEAVGKDIVVNDEPKPDSVV